MRRPEMLVPVTFLAAILLGTILLSLPWMSNGEVGLLEAFFTSVSSVCVTGLIVVDTGADFTTAGQAVILGLIQLGGLGIMTLSLFALVIVGRRVSMNQEAHIKEGFTAVARWRIGRLLGVVVGVTLVIEAIGAALLYTGFGDWWTSVFHSVSAFCNAGFSLNATSLQGLSTGIVLVVFVLFVLGGLGFTTLLELWPKRRGGRRFSLHGRIVLVTSGILLLGGTALLWAVEGGGFLDALFMSASTRTAGFDTVPVGEMARLSLLVMIPLMFVGASPGSTGGGIKTTTIALAYLMARSALKGHERVTIAGREIPGDLVRRMIAVLLCGGFVCFLAIFFLVLLEGSEGSNESFIALSFEAVSAFGTVGLSTGITPDLAVASKVLLCLVMFVGRVGSLSLFILLVRDKGASRVRYPEERILIG